MADEPTGHGTPSQPYTIHQDADADAVAGTDADADTGGERPARRRGPDPVALVSGLASLVVAALATTDRLGGVDPRWVLAGAAIVVGSLVLLVSLRRTSTGA